MVALPHTFKAILYESSKAGIDTCIGSLKMNTSPNNQFTSPVTTGVFSTVKAKATFPRA